MVGFFRALSFPALLLAATLLRGETPTNLQELPSAGASNETSHETATKGHRAHTAKLPTRSAPIGINLARPNHWSSSHPFVDAIKLADDWVGGTPRDFRDGRRLSLDAYGWVSSLAENQVARMVIFGRDAIRPEGVYTLKYQGSGEFGFEGGVEVLSRAKGELKVRIRNGTAVVLRLSATSPTDPIRSIALFYPGGRCTSDRMRYCDESIACSEGERCVPFEEQAKDEPFHPHFLEENAAFSVLRFVDWMDTNREANDARPFTSEMADWPKVESRRYHPVPFEIMAELANQLEADAWLTLPPFAPDGFYRDVFKAFSASIDPRRLIYIELGNELWNDLFRQHQQMNANGCRRLSSDPEKECTTAEGMPLCAKTSWNEAQARCRAYGAREQAHESARLFRIAAEVLGEPRIRRVLAGQIGAFDGRGRSMLSEEIGPSVELASIVDVYAVAPYFGRIVHSPEKLDGAFQKNKSQVHGAPAGVFTPISGEKTNRYGGPYAGIVRDLRGLKEFPNIRYAAYEGGPHFLGFDPAIRDRVIALNRDPRMGALYRQFLELWSELTGGALFLHYSSAQTYGPHGAWGIKEYQGQPRGEAPKFDAILRYIEEGEISRGER